MVLEFHKKCLRPKESFVKESCSGHNKKCGKLEQAEVERRPRLGTNGAISSSI